MVQRPSNSSAKPKLAGPECSSSGQRMARYEVNALRDVGARRAAMTSCFTEPTSVTIAPRLQMPRDSLGDGAVGANGRGDASATCICALHRLGGIGGNASSTILSLSAVLRVTALRAQATMEPAQALHGACATPWTSQSVRCR